LRQALGSKDLAELGRVAHSMKSASFNVGAQVLGEACQRLEHHCKNGEVARADELVAHVETLVEAIEPLLRKEMKQAA
jgi:HPt (histidine-containing phosphotransfer) domain-containing protein